MTADRPNVLDSLERGGDALSRRYTYPEASADAALLRALREALAEVNWRSIASDWSKCNPLVRLARLLSGAAPRKEAE